MTTTQATKAKKTAADPAKKLSPGVPKHLVEAIRKELRAMTEGAELDVDLSRIAKFADRAQEMLLSITDPVARMKRRYSLTPFSSNPSPDVAEEMGMAMPAMPTVGGVETYGASILRQIIPALKEYQQAQKETPGALVDAIASARRMGMTDVASELEKKLCGKPLEGARPIGTGFPLLSSPEPTVADYLSATTPLRYRVDVTLIPSVKKKEAIKVVHAMTSMSRNEAANLVDAVSSGWGLAAARTVADDVDKERAEAIKARLEAVGARVLLLPFVPAKKARNGAAEASP